MTKQQRNEIASTAIRKAGGNAKLAQFILGEGAGEEELKRMRWRIAKWCLNGIPHKYVFIVSQASGIGAENLSQFVACEPPAARSA